MRNWIYIIVSVLLLVLSNLFWVKPDSPRPAVLWHNLSPIKPSPPPGTLSHLWMQLPPWGRETRSVFAAPKPRKGKTARGGLAFKGRLRGSLPGGESWSCHADCMTLGKLLISVGLRFLFSLEIIIVTSKEVCGERWKVPATPRDMRVVSATWLFAVTISQGLSQTFTLLCLWCPLLLSSPRRTDHPPPTLTWCRDTSKSSGHAWHEHVHLCTTA